MTNDMSTTISKVIFNDHTELQNYYNYIRSSKDADTAIRWRNQFVWELARYLVGEEIVVYPKLAKYLGDSGQEMAEKNRKEHQVIKEHLYKLQSMKPDNPAFVPTLDAVMSRLQKHIEEEENLDYPQLERKMGAERSHKLAKTFERTKILVPTYSHPSVPNGPRFETIVGLFATPIDTLRDLLRKWP
ncbi:HHE domain-containing protein [Schizosaccharomyces octosporus yFS286]|uniref:HHE domain-containing protein n=1 Tax=Schizosaccharomyces octosporus (strain yFS286) TaxID=483514 RepID=S9PUL4_SCHOY|nr:HHE domain-containing protein [Schizosaccharomyces octosporus yFS286]EPX71662.1 HHE domain-containing protein [Schizosaccharomyces octosporus yFS286]